MLSLKRIAPAAQPRLRTSLTYVGVVVPLKRRTTSLPTCSLRLSRSTAPGAGAAVGATVASATTGLTSGASSSSPAPIDTPRTNAAAAAARTAARRRRTLLVAGGTATGYGERVWCRVGGG